MNYAPPAQYGSYDAYEVRSALRKEIKLGRVDEALYWANVMIECGEKAGRQSLVKQLWIQSAEDIDDPIVVLRAFAVWQMLAKVDETDHVFYLVAQMCRARKWWETEEGRETDWLWSKAIGDLKVPDRNHEVPSYALDRHTRRGWSIFRRTGQFDDRFSGTGLGRAKTIFLFLRDGLLAPGRILQRDDPAFLNRWRERREAEANSASDLEPNDPLGPEGTVPPPDQLFE